MDDAESDALLIQMMQRKCSDDAESDALIMRKVMVKFIEVNDAYMMRNVIHNL